MRSKNLTISILLIITSITQGFSQSDSAAFKNQFRLSNGYYHNQIFRFNDIEGSGWMENGIAHEYGFTYSYPMDDKLWMGIGLTYLRATNVYHSPYLNSDNPYSIEQVADVIYLPVFWQYNITNWFGFKVGMSLEIAVADTDYYNQNGLGFFGGPIIHYSPNSRVDFGIEPTVHVTAMLPIPQEFYQQHFLLTGANAFVAFRF